MAKKDKVPVVAIRQIVKMRDDEYHNYSYRVIAEHLKSEFGIEVTPQAIGYLYRKNKDNFINQSDSNSENSKQIKGDKSNVSNTKFQEFKKIETRNQGNPKEFVEFSDEEFNSMLKGE